MFDRRNDRSSSEKYYVLLSSPLIDGTDFRDLVGKPVSIGLSKETSDGVLLSQYYLFEKISVDDHFVVVVDPIDNFTIKKNPDTHYVTSGQVTVLEVLDLFEQLTWDKMWEYGIDMFVYRHNILYYLSANGLYVQLAWYVDKAKLILKDQFDKNFFAKTILKAAILYNNLDIIQFVTLELEPDLCRYGMDEELIMVMSKVAAKDGVEPDYCYHMVKLLISKGFYKDLSLLTIILKMHILLMENSGHLKTADLLKEVCGS